MITNETNEAMENIELIVWQKDSGYFYTAHTLNKFILILYVDKDQKNHLVLSININTDFYLHKELEEICEDWHATKFNIKK